MTSYIGRVQPAVLYGGLNNALGTPVRSTSHAAYYQKDKTIVTVSRLVTGSFKVNTPDGKLPTSLEQILKDLKFKPEHVNGNGHKPASNGNGHKA